MEKGAREGVPEKMLKRAGNGGYSLPERERAREAAGRSVAGGGRPGRVHQRPSRTKHVEPLPANV